MGDPGSEKLFVNGDGEHYSNRQTEPHLTNSMTLTENHLPYSYFPCLDSRPGAGKTWHETEVPFKDISLLETRCQHQNIDSVSVFQAAWALLLKYYLGNLHVSFAFDCIQKCDDPSKLDHLASNVSWGEARFDQCTTSSELLRHFHTRDEQLRLHLPDEPQVPDSRGVESRANTCLLYRQANQGVWTGLEESLLQHYFHRGYDVRYLEQFGRLY